MTQVAFKSKLRSFVRSSLHLCPDNWLAIGRVVVYNARAAHAFSAGIRYWQCRYKGIERSRSHATTIICIRMPVGVFSSPRECTKLAGVPSEANRINTSIDPTRDNICTLVFAPRLSTGR